MVTILPARRAARTSVRVQAGCSRSLWKKGLEGLNGSCRLKSSPTIDELNTKHPPVNLQISAMV